VGDAPSIEVHPDAAELIREKGGSVYVWADGAGMKHVHPHPPEHAVAWDNFQVAGISVFIDRTIDPPGKWVVVLHHLPFRHVDALWNGRVGPNALVPYAMW
jgi:hypothetical protein